MYCTQMNLASFVSCNCDPKYELKQLHEFCELRRNHPVISSRRVENICEELPLTLEGLCLTNTGYLRACYAKFIGEPIWLQKSIQFLFWLKLCHTYEAFSEG